MKDSEIRWWHSFLWGTALMVAGAMIFASSAWWATLIGFIAFTEILGKKFTPRSGSWVRLPDKQGDIKAEPIKAKVRKDGE